MSKKITQKQENFCLRYIECGDASEAYRHAYKASKMKPETINKRASELLNPKLHGEITGRVAELRAKAEEESLWTLDKIIKHHAEIVEAGMGRLATNHLISNGIGDGMSETVNMQMYDTNLSNAKGALVEIGKLLGYYTEKIKVEGELSLKDFVKTREGK